MVHDSVREELISKISSAAKPPKAEIREEKLMPNNPAELKKISIAPKPDSAPPTATSEISAKPTSPTLVEFHSKSATLPEWRLQLQNVVRQRQERGTATETAVEKTPIPRAKLITSGATALKAEPVELAKSVPLKNPTLNSALERIEKSRRQFLAEEEEPAEAAAAAIPTKANKNYPFYIAGKTVETVGKPAEANAPVNAFAKPKLASSLRTDSDRLDTNKLPPLPKPAQVSTSFESRSISFDQTEAHSVENDFVKIEVSETIETEITHAEIHHKNEENEEFDDCAPFALRFNAGLFDLIIGSFLSLFLLAPFMMLGGNWLSVAGVFAFLATCSLVMFIYLTTAIGFYGRTFGMRLFALEIVDVESEEYPTFHQAAVSSAVYLLSLALGGIGFLTLPFNEDKRAVHDLVSGTIMVREE